MTALDDRLAAVVTQSAADRVCVGRVTLDVVEAISDPALHPWAGSASYAALLADAQAVTTARSAVLVFHTPTAFASNVRNVTRLLPEPALVFRSLGRRWNAHAGTDLAIEDELLDGLCEEIRIERYELETREVRLHPRAKTKGFVGACEYGVSRRARISRAAATVAVVGGVCVLRGRRAADDDGDGPGHLRRALGRRVAGVPTRTAGRGNQPPTPDHGGERTPTGSPSVSGPVGCPRRGTGDKINSRSPAGVFQSMRLSYLTRVAVAVLIGWLAPVAGAAQGDPPAGMVVLPFVNISGAPADEWIGAGIAETIAAEMQGRLPGQSVRRGQAPDALGAPAASRGPGDSEARLVEIGRTAGAQWAVSGGYQRLGDRMRITARLLDVRSGAVVAATVVDGAVDDLFDLQDRVAADLVAGTRLGAAPEARGSARSAGSLACDRGPADELPGGHGRLRRGAVPAAGARESARGRRDARNPRAPLLRLLLPPSTGGSARPGGRLGRPAETTRGAAGRRRRLRGADLAPGVIDGPPPPIATGRHPPRRAAERHHPRRRAARRHPARRTTRRGVYYAVPAITDFIQQAPDEGRPPPRRRRRGSCSTRSTSTSALASGTRRPPSEWWPTRCAATRASSGRTTPSPSSSTPSTIAVTRWPSIRIPRANRRFPDHQRGTPEQRLEPGLDVRTGRFEGGWTVEMEIPFKSLRYRPGPSQIWGVQLRRNVRRKNEWNYITPLPISAGPDRRDLSRLRRGDAGRTRRPQRQQEPGGQAVRIGGVSTNLAASPPTRNAGDGNGGLDVSTASRRT